MDWPALRLTALLAACTSAVLLAGGLPLAWWLATTRWRGRVLVEAVVALPLVLPPTVLGFYILLALGPRGPLGQAYAALTGSGLPFSFAGLLLASVLYSLPFAVQPFAAGFRAVEPAWLEAAQNLGAPPWRAFCRVALPLARPGVLAGLLLSFAHTLGEFGVVLMVGGNIPGRTRTAAVAIYDQVQALDYAAAGQHAVFLLGCSFAVLALTYTMQRRPGWPTAHSVAPPFQ